MGITIALAGNPNSGKTTMFNHLTGSNQYVGNWPGVTVEKKEGKLKGHKDVKITDLPGIYSLSPYTLEEVVTRDYIINEKPDVILNIVDGSNIERNLYLTTQLLEMGIPVVVAINMIDIVRKRGDQIDLAKLEKALGCKVVETSAIKGEGGMEAAQVAINLAAKEVDQLVSHTFDKNLETSLSGIEEIVKNDLDKKQARWFAIKLFERDEKVLAKLEIGISSAAIESIISACEEKMDDDSESIITNERYTYIGKVVKNSVKQKNESNLTVSDKVDRIITNRFLALPIFVAIMWFVYYISVTSVGTILTDWTNDVFVGEILQGNVGSFLEGIGTAGWLSGLVVDGIIGGVGAVIGFLPQMLVLFIFLAILEDCGYMARIAFIMDRIFRKFGLSGKSFIPMLIGTGCGVPAIMASRTIENEQDRRMTVMTATFIPCGAKLPIIALIAAAIFNNSAWVATSAYFIGVGAIVLSGVILKKTSLFAGEPGAFVMELPQYHIPTVGNVFRSMWERGSAFVKKATSIILVSSVIIWFLSSFGTVNGSFGMVDELTDSMLHGIGSAVAPIFAPLGFGSWQATVATVMGLVAKEEVVGVFGVLTSIGNADLAFELVDTARSAALSPIAALFTSQVGAYAFLAFNLLCAPCFAAMGAIRREMGNWKWTFIAVGYQCFLAYVVALLINLIGNAMFNGASWMPAIAAVLVVIAAITYLFANFNKHKKVHTSRRAVDAKDGGKVCQQ